MAEKTSFTHRIATRADIPAIMDVMKVSIAENMKGFLTEEEIAAAQETMGLDTTLLDDGTYFVIEAEKDGETVMAGCGGWGKRKTLYGGNHTRGRDDSYADPETDAARIRAMYTHPAWTRQGVGTLLLELGENAAREAGFKMIELGSTVPGEPLYRARGYKEISRDEQIADNGQVNTIIVMRKAL
ncbi:GNAT family N-acetyltransferase [Hyphococcus luteus]|uniref:GNAT family N-acetyltransferase n=1 Tax=Hyphococcus luteus TaxID=2058213 RepID=A0A2S7K2F9_9PROT|nr:GNAT family N-acetyltransferase [Marinicaulis flavus]PQA86628.1 GNAT family N-acetyltransferase [Marinicaulis flavus]